MWRRWVQNSGGSTQQRQVRGPRDVKRRDWTAGRCCCRVLLLWGGGVCCAVCTHGRQKSSRVQAAKHSPFVKVIPSLGISEAAIIAQFCFTYPVLPFYSNFFLPPVQLGPVVRSSIAVTPAKRHKHNQKAVLSLCYPSAPRKH